MKIKMVLVISLILNAGLFAGVAYFAKQAPDPGISAEANLWPIRLEVAPEQRTERGVHFGPEFEVALSDSGDCMRPQLVDLESGRSLRQPSFEQFGRNGRAAVAWLRASGLDVARVTTAEGHPVCVGYYMAMVQLPEDKWDNIRAEEILSSSELATKGETKRLCINQQDETQVFLFKTQEGSRGILRMEAAMPDSRFTRIRYKLVVGGEIPESPELAHLSGQGI